MSKFDKYLMEKSKPLTAYKITYDDGTTSTTDMAADITLADAKKYFIGKPFTVETKNGKETKRKAIKVEKIN
jgi:hypothetical protein